MGCIRAIACAFARSHISLLVLQVFAPLSVRTFTLSCAHALARAFRAVMSSCVRASMCLSCDHALAR
eukprot:12447478-Alexandrium_andersonii.AAC.1